MTKRSSAWCSNSARQEPSWTGVVCLAEVVGPVFTRHGDPVFETTLLVTVLDHQAGQLGDEVETAEIAGVPAAGHRRHDLFGDRTRDTFLRRGRVADEASDMCGHPIGDLVRRGVVGTGRLQGEQRVDRQAPVGRRRFVDDLPGQCALDQATLGGGIRRVIGGDVGGRRQLPGEPARGGDGLHAVGLRLVRQRDGRPAHQHRGAGETGQ